MKKVTVFDLMEEMRHAGFCVVLKCMPKELGWLIQGAISEYDAPDGPEDKVVGHGLWCAEAKWVKPSSEWRHSNFAMGDTPYQAMKRLWEAVTRDEYQRAKMRVES